MNASSLISTALDQLLTPDTKLSNILQRVKAIGHFIGNENLKKWANLELNGYEGSGVNVPDYRKIGVVAKVDLLHEGFNFNGGQQRNQDMIIEYLDDDLRRSLKRMAIANSIAEIELVAEKDENSTVSIPHPIASIISQRIYEPNGWHIHRAWFILPPTQMAGVLTSIRSNLIDLLLELDQLDKDVALDSLQGRQAVAETVNKALNHSITVTGGNVNISHGSGAVQAANSGNAAQLNTAGSDATQSVAPAQAESLRELVEQVKQAIVQDATFDKQREEMQQEIERIEVQLEKPEPKKSIIKRAFESLTELAADGAGTMAGHVIFELLHKAPELLATVGLS